MTEQKTTEQNRTDHNRTNVDRTYHIRTQRYRKYRNTTVEHRDEHDGTQHVSIEGNIALDKYDTA